MIKRRNPKWIYDKNGQPVRKKKKPGPPPKPKHVELDRDSFEKFCGYQCTQKEIAGFFHVAVPTLVKWVEETYDADWPVVYENLSAAGKASLRAKQFAWADKQAIMAIFLGKNYLGQSDTPENQADAETLKKAQEILGNVDSVIEEEN